MAMHIDDPNYKYDKYSKKRRIHKNAYFNCESIQSGCTLVSRYFVTSI